MEDRPANPQDMSLLVVDDDKPFLERLARALQARGFDVETAQSVAEGTAMIRRRPPAYAVVDMRPCVREGGLLYMAGSSHM
ncbi:MAG: hypothetical protein AB7U38_12620, partial [Hyphomicrobiales bacterium]